MRRRALGRVRVRFLLAYAAANRRAAPAQRLELRSEDQSGTAVASRWRQVDRWSWEPRRARKSLLPCPPMNSRLATNRLQLVNFHWQRRAKANTRKARPVVHGDHPHSGLCNASARVPSERGRGGRSELRRTPLEAPLVHEERAALGSRDAHGVGHVRRQQLDGRGVGGQRQEVRERVERALRRERDVREEPEARQLRQRRVADLRARRPNSKR